jgi:hypothetical protein
MRQARQRISHMRPPVLILFCALAGCQSLPPGAVAPHAEPGPFIRLGGHDVAADKTAILSEVAEHVTAGLPIEAARARLEALGFRLFSIMPKSYRRAHGLRELVCGPDQTADENANRLLFVTSCDEIGAWGQRYFDLRLFVYFDEDLRVRRIEIFYVSASGYATRFAWYFSRRPNLREPLGLAVDDARTVMEVEGFHCRPATVKEQEKSGRPYLYCRALAETPLGGSIIRAQLFYDEAGKVTDTCVLKDEELFDGLLCMLPGDDDTPAWAVAKTIIFPIRLYAAVVVGGLEADLAMGHP